MKEIVERLQKFLGTTIPPISDECTYEQSLTKAELQLLIPEKRQAFFGQKAVILRQQTEEGAVSYIAMVTMLVTAKMCEGHMPGYPILPLAIGGWMLSQAGEIAVAYAHSHNGGSSDEEAYVPLVVETGPVKSKNRDFLVPGETILAVAKVRSHRFTMYTLDTEAWLDGQKVVEVPGMMYACLPWSKFIERCQNGKKLVA
ncbi:MAG: hypothetical protein M1324_01930 [Patescibacteria group bacterium]|nr:hypothetical protein [Patescibacteria group bacterium]